MSWIKKLLKKFGANNTDSLNDTTKPAKERQIEGKEDIEARVVYQYPKGAFRFPLIPDEEKDVLKAREPRTRNQKRESEKRVHKIPSEGRTVEEVVNKPAKNTRVEGRTIKKRSTRPFRPTEIPSPIYGYKREKNSPPIEFELQDFHVSEQENEINECEQYITSTPEEIIVVNMHEHRMDQHTEEVNEELIETPLLADNGLVEDDHVSVLSEKLEYDEGELTYPPFQTGEVKEDEISQLAEVILEEQDGPIEIEPSDIGEVREYGKDSIEGIKESKRSHIPFNVIMLQSDKRKLNGSPINEMKESVRKATSSYALPTTEFLNPPVLMNIDEEWTELQREILDETLFHFNVRASVKKVTQGPSVTRFEVHPEPGVKVNKITNLADDIKLSLAAKDIRIEAPIPGTHMIGIEVPNQTSRPVFISEVLNSKAFQSNPSPLTMALGLDISGQPIVTDIRKMPHGLIAGSTGSGKSVCINSILVSLLYKARPDDVKLMLIDPKVVELQPYNDIPHLVSPVITDVKAATAALKWAVEEMERRYEAFAQAGVRDISKFNEKAIEENQPEVKLPYLVIIIDELADLMMVSPSDVEEAICRIAQKARACGIHLIIATQRPSVDVITGLIKANIPTRIAFSVSSQVDSRTIIDNAGAERLLGKGDMLFLENGSLKPVRLQGTFVSDEEITQVVEFVKGMEAPNYIFVQEELIKKSQVQEGEDELFLEACEFILEQGHASASSLQRRFKIGYNRAARLIEMMEANGFISESKGSKPRDVLLTESDLESIS